MYFVASPLKHLTCLDPASEVKSLYLLQLRCAGAGEWQTRGAGSCRFPLTSVKGSVIIEHSGTWNIKDLGSGSGRAFSPLNQFIKVQFIYCKKMGTWTTTVPYSHTSETFRALFQITAIKSLIIKQVIIFLLVEVLP